MFKCSFQEEYMFHCSAMRESSYLSSFVGSLLIRFYEQHRSYFPAIDIPLEMTTDMFLSLLHDKLTP